MPDGTHTMRFQLYDAQSGGTLLWNSGDQSVQVASGLFNVELGVDQSDFNGQALWLEVTVGVETLAPRREILPVPYALSLRPGAEIISTGYPVLLVESTYRLRVGYWYGVVEAAPPPLGHRVYLPIILKSYS